MNSSPLLFIFQILGFLVVLVDADFGRQDETFHGRNETSENNTATIEPRMEITNNLSTIAPRKFEIHANLKNLFSEVISNRLLFIF